MTQHTWKERLNRATLRGTFTKTDKVHAGRWPSCVVGEMMKASGHPIAYSWDLRVVGKNTGEQLIYLGRRFDRVVYVNNIETAKIIYRIIQKVVSSHV